MASAYGQISRPKLSSLSSLSSILSVKKSLKDSTEITAFHISSSSTEENGSIFAPEFPRLVSRMYTLFRAEIEDGNTYPQEELLDEQAFVAYFLGGDAFIVVKLEGMGVGVDDGIDWEERLLGFFYVKPNFPGRCSHICNGGFFTAPVARNRGVGRCMAELYLKLAPALGYKASMFNLVFDNNTASVKLWRSLGFREIGRIPKAGRLRSAPKLVDAIIFYYDFTEATEGS